MRNAIHVGAALIPLTAATAHADSWQARNILVPERSAGTCAKDGGGYSLDLTGTTFTVKNVNGQMFSITLPADGAVKQGFRSPSGARLEMVGNAKSKDLEIINSSQGCRWKLTPEPK